MYITMIVIRTNLFIFILDDPVTGLASSSSTFSLTSSLPVLNTLGVRTLMSLVARVSTHMGQTTAPQLRPAGGELALLAHSEVRGGDVVAGGDTVGQGVLTLNTKLWLDLLRGIWTWMELSIFAQMTDKVGPKHWYDNLLNIGKTRKTTNYSVLNFPGVVRLLCLNDKIPTKAFDFWQQQTVGLVESGESSDRSVQLQSYFT